MRIYGNRLLKTLPGQNTRPTLAKVREALFNIWQGRIRDCHWLDLCAGSGSMGAEALCRGALLVVGIEQSPRCCQIIRENWQGIVQQKQELRIVRGDVIVKLKSLAGEKFDLVYFDPPYQSSLYEPVLQAIANYNLLSREGEIAVEHNPKIWRAKPISGLDICRQKNYGNTTLTFYKAQA